MLTLLLVYFETQKNDANFHFCKWRGRIGFVSYQLITFQIVCLGGFTGPFGRFLACFVLTKGHRAAFSKVTTENTQSFQCPDKTSGFQLSGAQYVEIYPLLGVSAWAPNWHYLSFLPNPLSPWMLSLLWEHLLLKAVLDPLQQGEGYCSWGLGCSPLADGKRLYPVACFKTTWSWQCGRWLSAWTDEQTTAECHGGETSFWKLWHPIKGFYFSHTCGGPGRWWFPTTLDQCRILKDLVEWHMLWFMWKHCLICLYGPAAEYWRRPCRPQVVQDHTGRDHGLSLLCFPDWFTLWSSVSVYVLCIQT